LLCSPPLLLLISSIPAQTLFSSLALRWSLPRLSLRMCQVVFCIRVNGAQQAVQFIQGEVHVFLIIFWKFFQTSV